MTRRRSLFTALTLSALVLAAWERALSWPMMKAVFEGTMRTTAMIMLIAAAAFYLNFVLGLQVFRKGTTSPLPTVLEYAAGRKPGFALIELGLAEMRQ